MLCVGLDPDPHRLPAALDGEADAVSRSAAIVAATADLVCAFKPQFAHFAAHRAEPSLERLCRYIRETYPDVLVLLDAKRGDIGNSRCYACWFIGAGEAARSASPRSASFISC